MIKATFEAIDQEKVGELRPEDIKRVLEQLGEDPTDEEIDAVCVGVVGVVY